MDALDIAKAHIVGHSMGAYTALHIGMRHPERCISVTAAGCGWGSVADPAAREAMRKQAAETAADVFGQGHGRRRGALRRQSDASDPEAQRPARLRRIRPHALGALRDKGTR